MPIFSTAVPRFLEDIQNWQQPQSTPETYSEFVRKG
jgi:hypothetical protein